MHELFDISESGKWDKDEQRCNRFVFIGRNLDRDAIRKSFVKHVIDGEPLDNNFEEPEDTLVE